MAAWLFAVQMVLSGLSCAAQGAAAAAPIAFVLCTKAGGLAEHGKDVPPPQRPLCCQLGCALCGPAAVPPEPLILRQALPSARALALPAGRRAALDRQAYAPCQARAPPRPA